METVVKTYTTLELVPILHASKWTLDKKCRIGEIPAKKVGKGWIVEEGALQNYIKKTRR